MDGITPHRWVNEQNKAYIGNCEEENEARHGIRKAFHNPQEYLIL